jgi:hypothetical protein
MTINIAVNTTINFNVFNSADEPAVQYVATNAQLTIATGRLIAGSINSSIFSDQNGNTLVNNGVVFSGSLGTAAFFSGANAAITNNFNAEIVGQSVAVGVGGDGVSIINHGRVFAYQSYAVVFNPGSSDVVLTNDGDIYGEEVGVYAGSAAADGGVINNFGQIRSNQVGIFIETNGGLITEINNAVGGIIRGLDAAVGTSPIGRIALDNRGTLVGDVDCGATFGNVNDLVINRGKIKGDTHLGMGNDKFTTAGAGTSGKVLGEAATTRSSAATVLTSSTAA